MLSSDPVTFESLKLLWGLANSKDGKPILVWVGAGASSWLGYERWEEVAERFHRTFNRKSSATYKAREAEASLSAAEYSKLFQLCFDANPQLYRSILANSFTPVPLRPVYHRFINALTRIERVSVVTTNIDEMLEHSLNGFQVLQRSDLTLASDLMASGRRFLGKLHGSVSSIETAVFKSDDYEALALDAQYSEPGHTF